MDGKVKFIAWVVALVLVTLFVVNKSAAAKSFLGMA